MRFSRLVITLLGVAWLPYSQAARAGTLLWSDEFKGDALSSTWTNGKFWWDGDGYNNATHVYRTSATEISDGVLKLTLSRQPAISFQGTPVDYVSGLVQTGGIEGRVAPGFTFKYGYAEARIRVPSGQGYWPAFWMLPASYNDDAGEIDVMEYLGSEPNNIYQHVHINGKAAGGVWTSPDDMSLDWHTYAVDWQPTYLKYYVDGVLRRTITNSSLIPQEPEYLILNLQTGGWAGFPDPTRVLPATMKIDYVRVYSNSPALVPEPAAGPLMLPALGMLALSLRRPARPNSRR